MADTKFTPGPWRPVSMHLEGPDGQTVQDELPGHPDYHLRIAAPDLYAVLEALLETDADISEAGIQALLAEARAVLAKARGEMTADEILKREG